jgi:hypothetical protein
LHILGGCLHLSHQNSGHFPVEALLDVSATKMTAFYGGGVTK